MRLAPTASASVSASLEQPGTASDPAQAVASAEAARPLATARPCAECGASLACASLILACDHNLCLRCAARALQQPSAAAGASAAAGPILRCQFCRADTEVDGAAAKYLSGLLRADASECSTAATATSAGNQTSLSSAASTPNAMLLEPAFGAARCPHDGPAASSGWSGLRGPWPEPVPMEQTRLQNSAVAAPLSPLPQLAVRLPHPSSPRLAAQPPAAPPPAEPPPSPVPQRLGESAHQQHLCGQCEGQRSANVHCQQCDELFCRPCSEVTHRRGRMADHHLRLVTAKGDGNAVEANGGSSAAPSDGHPGLPTVAAAPGAAEPVPQVRTPPNSECVPLLRRFHRCPAHPEEPLQYFCLKCPTACICAECVLNGDHRGHDVLNAREAAQLLPEKVAELANAAHGRAQELEHVTERVREGRQSLSFSVQRGRQELQGAVEHLSGALRMEEEALLAEVNRCAADVAELLLIDNEASLQEAYGLLHAYVQAGDVAQVLTWYSRLKNALAAPAPERPNFADHQFAAQLHGQLQRGFEGRLQGLAGLAARIRALPELRPGPAAGPLAEPAGLGGPARGATPDVRRQRLPAAPEVQAPSDPARTCLAP